MLHLGNEACLSSSVERLLLDVVTDGFILYCCGPRTTPHALVASYQWEDYVDLITIRRFGRITGELAALAQATLDGPWAHRLDSPHSRVCPADGVTAPTRSPQLC